MDIGVQGMLQIIRRKFEGIRDDNGEYIVHPWRLNVEGNIVEDVKNRGVDMKAKEGAYKLPKYSFRDDALDLHRIIKNYVETTVDMAYSEKDDDGKPKDDKHLPWLHGDYEIQAWGKLMHDPVNEDHPELSGCGIKGLPYENEINQEDKIYFKSFETLVDTITSIIYTCSVEHAAVNFHQYREHAFPVNYPALLHGDPPRSKGGYDPNYVTLARSPDGVLQALPTKQETLVAVNITQVISNYATVDKDDHNILGHFPVQYQLTPDGGTPQNVKDFQKALKELSGTMQERRARSDHRGEEIPSYESSTYSKFDQPFKST